MASGKLANGRLTANTVTAVYQVPSGKIVTFNMRIVNNDPTNPVAVRATISAASAVQANGEFILPKDVPLPPASTQNSVAMLEDTALMASAGEFINLWTNGSAVDYRLFGFEK